MSMGHPLIFERLILFLILGVFQAAIIHCHPSDLLVKVNLAQPAVIAWLIEHSIKLHVLDTHAGK
jgi:hypothetical protein